MVSIKRRQKGKGAEDKKALCSTCLKARLPVNDKDNWHKDDPTDFPLPRRVRQDRKRAIALLSISHIKIKYSSSQSVFIYFITT